MYYMELCTLNEMKETIRGISCRDGKIVSVVNCNNKEPEYMLVYTDRPERE